MLGLPTRMNRTWGLQSQQTDFKQMLAIKHCWCCSRSLYKIQEGHEGECDHFYLCKVNVTYSCQVDKAAEKGSSKLRRI